MRKQSGNGAWIGRVAGLFDVGLPALVGAQDIDGPFPSRDDVASLEMTLLVEPPPDDAPFQRPTPPPEVRPHVTPPPPPGDPFAKYLGLKEDLKKKYGTSYYLNFMQRRRKCCHTERSEAPAPGHEAILQAEVAFTPRPDPSLRSG